MQSVENQLLSGFPMNPKRKDQYDVIDPDESLCPMAKPKEKQK